MITAIVRYRLPKSIDYHNCLAHFTKIAPSFKTPKGLISKHFIWSESGIAGGVYQWKTLKDAKAFYSGPWLQGIVERYGMKPEIEYFTVFCVTDNERGSVRVIEAPRAASKRAKPLKSAKPSTSAKRSPSKSRATN